MTEPARKKAEQRRAKRPDLALSKETVKDLQPPADDDRRIKGGGLRSPTTSK
jgi:hypothetical protein